MFISIDDNEHHRLRMVMDEIFGVEVQPSEKCRAKSRSERGFMWG